VARKTCPATELETKVDLQEGEGKRTDLLSGRCRGGSQGLKKRMKKMKKGRGVIFE